MGVDITACNRPGSRRHRFSRLLYVVEWNVKSPILDLALFANRGFLSGAFANFTLIAFAYSAFFLMPLYLRSIVGQEPFAIGFFMLPITVLIVIVAPVAGRIVDTQRRQATGSPRHRVPGSIGARSIHATGR